MTGDTPVTVRDGTSTVTVRDGTSTVTVRVVADHTLFRRGLMALLAGDPRFAVVREAGDAGEAQRRAGLLAEDL